MSETTHQPTASPETGPITKGENLAGFPDWGGPPGTDMRLLQKGEIIVETDVLANGRAVPADIVGAFYLVETPIFRGVGLGEPLGAEGVAGVDGPSCPAGEPGPMADMRGNSFFGEPGPTGTVGCSCAGAAGVMGPPLQPGEELVDWLGDGGAPWGKCVGCGAAFTAAGGLPGGFCVRCSKAKSAKVLADEVPHERFLEALRRASPEKRAAAVALFNGPATSTTNDDLAAFAALRTELPSAGRYRILEPGEKKQEGDEYSADGGATWKPTCAIGGEVATNSLLYRRPVQGGVGLYEEAAMAAAVDNFGTVAPEPWLSNWDRLMRWLFPPLHVPTPEAPAEWKDVLHLDTVLKAPLSDRLRFLVSGRLHVRSLVVCENEVGKSIAHTSAAALAPGRGNP